MPDGRFQLQSAAATGTVPDRHPRLGVQFDDLAIAAGGFKVGGANGAKAGEAGIGSLRGRLMPELHAQGQVAAPGRQVQQGVAQVDGGAGQGRVAAGFAVDAQVIDLFQPYAASGPHEGHRHAAIDTGPLALVRGPQGAAQALAVHEVTDGLGGLAAAPVDTHVPVPVGIQPLQQGAYAAHLRFIALGSGGKFDQSAANIVDILAEIVERVIRGHGQRYLFKAGEDRRGSKGRPGIGLQIGGLEAGGHLGTDAPVDAGVNAAAPQWYDGGGKGLEIEQVVRASRAVVAPAPGNQALAIRQDNAGIRGGAGTLVGAAEGARVGTAGDLAIAAEQRLLFIVRRAQEQPAVAEAGAVLQGLGGGGEVTAAALAVVGLGQHAVKIPLHDHVDDAGDGVGAVNRRSAVLENFHPLYRGG